MEEAFKQLLQNQMQIQAQQQQLIEAIMHAIKAQPRSANSIVDSLCNRISSFSYDPEAGDTFEKWFNRYEETITKDGEGLDDAARARLIVMKLERREHEKYVNHILPKTPSDLNFEETTKVLKKLFSETKSLARLRYELLSVKFDGIDRKDFTGQLKRRFAAARWNEMTEDQAQCLLWIIAHNSRDNLDLRLRALRELECSPKITVTELAERIDEVIALRNDAEVIGGGSYAGIHAVSKRQSSESQNSQRTSSTSTPPSSTPSAAAPPYPCPGCGANHWRRECKLPSSIVCRNCQRTGHLARVCRHDPQQDVQSNAIFIAQATSGTGNRIYTDVIINGQPIRMQLDTGSEVTLLNTQDWIRLQRPQLAPPTLNLRSACNEPIEILGQFRCNFTLHGQHGSGLCHVTNTETLLGMDWLAQDTPLFSQLLHGSVSSTASPDHGFASHLKSKPATVPNFSRQCGTRQRQFIRGRINLKKTATHRSDSINSPVVSATSLDHTQSLDRALIRRDAPTQSSEGDVTTIVV